MEHEGKRPHTRPRTPVKRLVVDLLSVQYIDTSKCVETTNTQDIHFEPLENVMTVKRNDTLHNQDDSRHKANKKGKMTKSFTRRQNTTEPDCCQEPALAARRQHHLSHKCRSMEVAAA